MAVSSSVSELCIQLISSAFQRCRVSDDICRLSVLLKSSPASDLPIIQISISDTGIGSSLEEFQNLRCRMEAINAEIWDGLLSVTTTSFCDNEVYHYLLNLRETISSRRLTRLPSNPKNGTKFSGTEARLSISERLDILVSQINCFFHKILILKISNVAIEMVVEREDVPGSHSEHFFLADDSYPLPFSISNVEHLTSGLEDYVLKHGHMLNQTCNSCFPTGENLKVGNGTACSLESHRSSGPGLMMEVVIIISELEPTCPSYGKCSSKTDVLYFEDFKPCPISESLQNALTSIDWKSYGLTLGNNVDEGGNLPIGANLPAHTRMVMVLHCYHKQEVISPSARPMTRTNRHLIKRAVKLALDDLKEKHAGILVRSYAPDLARSIAGLVLSSNDPDFQEECFSLLGLQSREIRGETVEEIIKEKIISIIDVNDKKSQRSKDVAVAPLLFEGDCFWNSNSQDMEFEEVECVDFYEYDDPFGICFLR
ncbi:type 2 DNA topoisomerase 6 subunit B-like isoform X2 [Jatropha curcas]|uniref:type 2 DNA topoisomerase 6 subunit B-like isoform X2 n=1 Tax=Jatropha curcas TaxID=180498 RepID=UPI001895456A|nr:type 2 DNA topoisomerase 6 subunit B-like isoform X2 [Jatropha curcas]